MHLQTFEDMSNRGQTRPYNFEKEILGLFVNSPKKAQAYVSHILYGMVIPILVSRSVGQRSLNISLSSWSLFFISSGSSWVVVFQRLISIKDTTQTLVFSLPHNFIMKFCRLRPDVSLACTICTKLVSLHLRSVIVTSKKLADFSLDFFPFDAFLKRLSFHIV